MSKLDRSLASLRFIGKGLDPIDLSEHLQFAPPEGKSKTSVKIKQDNRVVWSVSFGEPDASDMGKKIETLLGWFTKDIAIWKEISESYRGEIFCGLFLDEWNSGFELSTELLQKLSERNLAIGFDLYSPTETWGRNGSK